MPASLWELILRLLDSCAEPVVGAAELGRYPAEQLAELIGAGILRETCQATEIPRPARYGPGPDLIVRGTALGLFGVAEEDDYHDPMALTEEDVRQYAVSVPALIAEIRRRNGISGGGVQEQEGLYLVGTKPIEGLTRFPVYLSLPNPGEQELLARCLRARRGLPGALAVVLVPREPNLSAEMQRLLDEGGVRVVGLEGGTGLEGLAVDWAAIERLLPGSPVEIERYALRKKGEVWELTFEGQTVSVAATKGMAYIAELIRAPGRKIFVADLFFAVHGETPVRLGDSGEALDDKARREYRRRAEALRDQLAEAERNNDLGRSESLRWELEQLASQMIAAQDLSGRSRRSQDDRERVRKAVSMAIGRALGTIRKHAPELAEHLQKHLEQGYFLSYTGTIPWKF